jgi:tetratricopeptide (TPR) repeat protein
VKFSKYYHLFLAVALFQSISTSAKETGNIDSLKKQLFFVKNDTSNLNVLFSIGQAYLALSNVDSALSYFKKTENLAIKSKAIAKEVNSLLKQSEIYLLAGMYPKALEISFKALKLATNHNNKNLVCMCYEQIGSIYINVNNYGEALKYFKLDEQLNSETKNKDRFCVVFNNLAISYNGLGQTDISIEYFNKALLEARKKNINKINDNEISTLMANIAILLIEKGKYEEAIDTLQKVRQIKKQLGDLFDEPMILQQIGDAYYKMGKYDLAKKFTSQSIDLSTSEKELLALNESYFLMAKILYKLKNYEMAYDYFYKYNLGKDSIFSSKNAEMLGDLKTNHEVDKKETELKLKAEAEKEKLLAIGNEEKKQQTIIIISVIGVLFIVIIFSFFLYRRFKITSKQKTIIELKELETQKQKHLVEERNKEITDSINYAKRLQSAILPPVDLIQKTLKNSFVYYKPKDIVAGDFYWFYDSLENKTEKKENRFILIAAADSTGHGVPGAMVSIVCSNALNKAVKEFGLNDTGQILDKTTDLVLETFEKSGEVINDGMDISLLKIEFYDKDIVTAIKWSGANNSLVIVSPNTNTVTEIKANKQPIGKTDNRINFATNNIAFEKDSMLYLITDGYADQFGGSGEKKFKHKQLKELFQEINHLPSNKQYEILNQKFMDWKGNLDQVDDVTILGIRI